MLIVAIGVTAGTAAQASQKGGLYVLYLGKILNIEPDLVLFCINFCFQSHN